MVGSTSRTSIVCLNAQLDTTKYTHPHPSNSRLHILHKPAVWSLQHKQREIVFTISEFGSGTQTQHREILKKEWKVVVLYKYVTGTGFTGSEYLVWTSPIAV